VGARSDPDPQPTPDRTVDGTTHDVARIRPEDALAPGSADARNVLVVWFQRKSVYGLVALGMIAGALTQSDLAVDWRSGAALERQLWSPLAPIVIGFALRLATNVMALLLAFPLARAYEVGLAPRTNVGSSIGRVLDLLNLARGYRALRWTHHVRQVALARLGERGRRLGRLDPIMDVTNITLWVIAVMSFALTADARA
jgi:hypothetical protein